MSKKHQLISSLVIFNHFREKGKDAGSILDDFIIYVIKDRQPKPFDYSTIYNYLKDEFDFDIPKLVIEKRLHKIEKDNPEFLSYKNNKFETKQITLQNSISDEINNALSDEEQLFEELFNFIEVQLKRKILDDEKDTIRKNFINYFLGSIKDDEYKIYINAFIIENKKKDKNNSIINNVANGIIVYNGLVYQNTFENRQFEKLIIYVNMEIIFHYMGYNGIVFQQIINELFEIIIQINKKNKIIYLHYTSKEKNRIDEFFDAIAKNNTSAQTNTASKEIIKKCGKDYIKIQEEKLELFKKLEKNGFITEKNLPNIDYNSDENKKYNIDSAKILEKFKDIENVGDISEFLNKLSVLRANYQCTIENAKYIFLTEERSYINVANYIKKENEEQKVPLALTIQHLTSILWYKQGNQFSKKGEIPLIFKADTRAKISLALDINNHSDLLYREVESRKKEMEEENAKKILYDIKSMPTKPEEIDENNIEDILELSNADMEYFVKKKKIVRMKNKNLKERILN